MIGRTDKLKQNKNIKHYKARSLDLSSILFQPQVSAKVGRYCQVSQKHGLENALDKQQLISLSKNALNKKTAVKANLKIKNINRNIGTMLGSLITTKYPNGLKNDNIKFKCTGSAGQSFGAFIPKGLTLELEGDANDYVGKGLSGGKIIVYPSKNSNFCAAENIIIGNVAFYGATSGEAYINGVAGERFCVRNSGISAVVESVGEHGCEYMTGGKVVILGKTGKNFAAGMSGGIAYIYDKDKTFSKNLNTEMVSLSYLSDPEEINQLKKLISNHYKYTKSLKAKNILAIWNESINHFVKVLPEDYKRMLKLIKEKHNEGLSGDEAIMAAFEANKNEKSRVGGN
jgi:glutamate synthase (ferredoxin)